MSYRVDGYLNRPNYIWIKQGEFIIKSELTFRIKIDYDYSVLSCSHWIFYIISSSSIILWAML